MSDLLSPQNQTGETNLSALLRNMQPSLNKGDYVFCTVSADFNISGLNTICTFREQEGLTLILEKSVADAFALPYSYIAAWITLTVHSSLEATGLTAAFSRALADAGISCNVVAAFYHDHIFVDKRDAQKAMEVLKELSGKE